jgi:hypothetical protein
MAGNVKVIVKLNITQTIIFFSVFIFISPRK